MDNNTIDFDTGVADNLIDAENTTCRAFSAIKVPFAIGKVSFEQRAIALQNKIAAAKKWLAAAQTAERYCNGTYVSSAAQAASMIREYQRDLSHTSCALRVEAGR